MNTFYKIIDAIIYKMDNVDDMKFLFWWFIVSMVGMLLWFIGVLLALYFVFLPAIFK